MAYSVINLVVFSISLDVKHWQGSLTEKAVLVDRRQTAWWGVEGTRFQGRLGLCPSSELGARLPPSFRRSRGRAEKQNDGADRWGWVLVGEGGYFRDFHS